MYYESSDEKLDTFISEVILNLPKIITTEEFVKIYTENFAPIMEAKYGIPKSWEKKGIFYMNNTRDLFFIMKKYDVEVIPTPQEKINYKEKGFRRLGEVEEKVNCARNKEIL